MKMYDLDGLVTNSDIASLLGVSRGAVVNWRHRYKSFPKPVHYFAGAPVWDRKHVLAWYRTHIEQK